MSVSDQKADSGRNKASRSRESEPPGNSVIAVARAFLVWERAWPVILIAAAPFFIFAILTMLGLWLVLPALLHWLAIVAALGVSVGGGVWAYGKVLGRHPWPDRRAAIARLEHDGAVRYDALHTQNDKTFGEHATPLWAAHQADMRRQASAARLSFPRPLTELIDPHGIRFGAPALLALGVVVAGDTIGARLSDGLVPTDPDLRRGGIADMWVEPPAYTGRPPLYLLKASDKIDGTRAPILAPVGSKIVLQAHGSPRQAARLDFAYAETGNNTRRPDARTDDEKRHRVIEINQNGVLRLSAGGVNGQWPINIIPDTPPRVQITGEPAKTPNHAILLSGFVTDDYGVVDGALELSLTPTQTRPLDAPAFDTNILETVRAIPLDKMAGPNGERIFELDLSADPWAGLMVRARLQVRDGAGQIARSDPIEITLPERPFTNPLAKAVVEQRQTLAIAPNHWRRAQTALNGLTIGPDRFYNRPSEYLLMRSALWRITGDGTSRHQSGGDFNETVNWLWPLALQLEDKLLSDARASLEAAQKALRDALERGASPEELARLTENLRNAMAQYLSALAQSPTAPTSNAAQSEAEQMALSDLNDILDSIRDLGSNGAADAAQGALDQLQKLLNNLQFAGDMQRNSQQAQSGAQGAQGQAGAQGAQAGGPAGDAGTAAGLIGRQRDLADATYTRQRNRQLGPGSPNSPEQGTANDLATTQNSLTNELGDLLDQLRQAGPDGGNNGDSEAVARGRRALQDAHDDMRTAEETLQAGALDAAETAMNSAVRNLRVGAASLAAAMPADPSDGQAQAGSQEEGAMRDPLGRPIGAIQGGDNGEVSGQSDAQAARELLKELWRRLSTGERTEEEIEYLERLLERF